MGSNPNVAANAIPVYLVAQPTVSPSPTDRRLAAGAIPVYFTAQGTNGAIPVRVTSAGTNNGSDQTNNANAIPVWDAGGPSTPPLASDQRLASGAIPVWRVN